VIAKILKRVSGLFLLALAAVQAHANIELPHLLSDGAVLQRNAPIPVWGTAPAGAQVVARFADEQQQIQADAQGNWRAVFSARKAGGPYELNITSGEFSRTVSDLLIGDVWVASGQSNMEWVVRDSDGASAEIASTNHPQIRHFKVPRSWAVEPSTALAGGDWQLANSDNLGDFTAVGWYFAKVIHRETGVPVGLINSSWGGSRIEGWMSAQSLGISSEEAQATLLQMLAAGEAKADKVRQLLQRWPGSLVTQIDSAVADWSAATLNEQDWLTIHAPNLWEAQDYPGVDGVMWYRKTFELSAAEAKQDITLGLGRVDDADITWINGHKVGETNAYDKVRTYKVHAKFLQPGKNQIAVRVEDNQGGGGIYSENDLLYVETSSGKRYSLAGEWKIKADRVTVAVSDQFHNTGTALYNKMVYPLFQVPVKGVLWYQGESNAYSEEDAENYRSQFAGLIQDWRSHWNNPKMPFYWVQLANFISGSEKWPFLREAQTATLSLKNTGQAITIDIGDPKDIHPRDKKTVGERLARIALNQTYDKNKVHFRGPVLQSAAVKKNQLIVKFKTAKSLALRGDNDQVNGFEIADAAGQFKPVTGSIKDNTVILPLTDASKPTAVRYAWSDNPEEANLQDKEGLPAEPFRTEL
jgi:Domain of unknown function (DUF303).